MTVQQFAKELRDLLAPACERIEIAGSVRRGKAEPKDIELLAIPKMLPQVSEDMFGAVVSQTVISALDGALMSLVENGPWEFDQVLRRNGSKYKRLSRFDNGRDVCCDLFIVTAETWGAQFAIRTGPADFSHMLVTRALRMGMKQEDGRLWRIHRDNTKTVIETPEERDYFAALGLPWLEPEQRGKVPV